MPSGCDTIVKKFYPCLTKPAQFGAGRKCKCGVILSRYNSENKCNACRIKEWDKRCMSTDHSELVKNYRR